MSLSEPVPFFNRLLSRAVLGVMAFVVSAAVPWQDGAAQPPGAAANGDLNLLLRLLSQDICIGRIDIARPIDPLWIKDIRALQSSSDARVAETAQSVEQCAVVREEALKLLEKTKEKIEEIRKDNPVDIVDAIRGALPADVSDDELDEAERSGRITHSEADAYRARRGAQNDAALRPPAEPRHAPGRRIARSLPAQGGDEEEKHGSGVDPSHDGLDPG